MKAKTVYPVSSLI